MKTVLESIVDNEEMARAGMAAINRHSFGPALRMSASCVLGPTAKPEWSIKAECDIAQPALVENVALFWAGFADGWRRHKLVT